MTDVEKAHFREVHARMLVGYKRAEEDRDARVRETSTADGIRSLLCAFEMAAKLPPRSTSGFVEFYQALARAR